MLTLGVISMFINEEVYLLKNEDVSPVTIQEETEDLVEDFVDETEVEEPIVAPVIAPVYNPVLFIVDKPLSGLAEETFNKLVFNALKLTESDFSIQNLENISVAGPEEVNSKKIVLFGTSFSGFSQKYKVHPQGEKIILLADSMERIAADQNLKKELWANLQLMFPAK